jgi:5'-3' exonuclease
MEIDLSVLLAETELSMEQFIELCIMCGCDYATNIRGIGAVRALSLIKQHGSIEAVIKVRVQDKRGWEGQVACYSPVPAAEVRSCQHRLTAGLSCTTHPTNMPPPPASASSSAASCAAGAAEAGP